MSSVDPDRFPGRLSLLGKEVFIASGGGLPVR